MENATKIIIKAIDRGLVLLKTEKCPKKRAKFIKVAIETIQTIQSK
jgi:hypothetical protein